MSYKYLTRSCFLLPHRSTVSHHILQELHRRFVSQSLTATQTWPIKSNTPTSSRARMSWSLAARQVCSHNHSVIFEGTSSNTHCPRHRLLRRRSLSRIRRKRHNLLLQSRPRRHRRLQTSIRLPIRQIPRLRPRLQPSRRSNSGVQPRVSPQQNYFRRF